MSRILAAALVACLGSAACAPRAPSFPPGPDRQQTVLTDEALDDIATILRLEDHRTFDPERFRQFTSTPNTEVRRRAVTAAGRIGDVGAVPLLAQIIRQDPNALVRADAAFALGLLGDTSATTLDALRGAAPADWVPVRGEETKVVVEIVGAMGRLGSDAARAQVVDVLRRAYPAEDAISSAIAGEALLAVWRFAAGPGRAVSAARFLQHPDPELRWRAALALTRIGDAETAGWLLPGLEDDDARVRALAARGLAARIADPAGLGEPALEGLTDAAGDQHPHVRINALRALGTFGERAPLGLLAAGLRDQDPNVSVATAAVIAELGHAVADTLVAFVEDQQASIPVRAAALAALGTVEPEVALPIVTEWSSGSLEARYAAARTLPPLSWPAAAPLLEALMGDPDPRVAVAATEAAGALAGRPALDHAATATLRGLLLDAVGADDPRQRTVALRGLGPLLRQQDAPVIMDAYQRTVDDPQARATAIAAVRALGTIETLSPGPAAAFFQRFQPPADRWIRIAVADALGDRWGPPPAAAAADDHEFYRHIVQQYVAPALSEARRPVANLQTRHGDIRVELLAEEAPLTVHNFVTLAAAEYYDDGVWHRVVPNFVLQDGAPAGDPSGGPGWTIRDEINRLRYGRGVMGMALSGPDTGGSQWFITHSSQPHLDGGYTVFGRVLSGHGAMDRVVQGDMLPTIRISH